MGNLLESCTTIAGQRKRLDAAARHKKTDESTPKDTVVEKKSWETEQKSCDLAVNNAVTESKNETAKNDTKTGLIEAPNDEIKDQDEKKIEQVKATNETAKNDTKTGLIEAPNDEIKDQDEKKIEQVKATNETAKNDIKTGIIEAPNDEIKEQDDERIVEQVEVTNDENETAKNDTKTGQIKAPNDEIKEQDDERIVEQVKATNDENEVSDDISNGLLVAEQDTESHDGHESLPEVQELLQNGVQLENDEVGVVDDDEVCKRWSFPPVLDQFDLMDTETDPTELEAIFTDERMCEIYLDVTQDGPRLGISIVGGQGSPSGDLPIVVKRILPGSLAEQDGRLKSGDELVAMNEKLLVGVAKDVAINALSNLDGTVRLLVLQDV
ncbi:PDZ domain-containing protein 2-like isoform X2 [Halichondria panicea]|uniref:PDZ domain-containing protein 2-like isoform X2 n=1 Tax=Halichondria panicea TaxID=6063 RepID=UPI00312BB5E7